MIAINIATNIFAMFLIGITSIVTNIINNEDNILTATIIIAIVCVITLLYQQY